jgi:2'-5' RNA ligase
MRVFIAVDIGERIRAALGELQEELRSSVDIKKSDVKWVEPENMHLTLKFLGEIKDEKVVEVCNIVENVAGEQKSFELAIETVGQFGGRSARVLWVGTGRGSENLVGLAKELEKQLAIAGWPEESREFSGHLTLCRVRKPAAGVKLAQISEGYKDFKAGVVSVDSVLVYQSQLKPSGPIYTVLGNYKLI